MKRLVAVLTVAVIAVPLLVLYAQNTGAPPGPNATKPFNVPVVTVWVKKPAEGGIIENPRIETLGSRSFIVGRIPDLGIEDVEDYRKGFTFWFPIDDVHNIQEFQSVEQAREVYKKYEEANE